MADKQIQVQTLDGTVVSLLLHDNGDGTYSQAAYGAAAAATVLAAGSAIVGKVGTDQTTPGTTDHVSPISGVNGVTGGSGVVGTGTQRVVLATDVALPAGTALLGKVSTDQTTPGTTDHVSPISGVNGVTGGSGTVGTGTQRVVLATDVALPAGTALLGKTGIDQTTPGTTNLVAVTNAGGYSAALTITRPANTTAYTANDVVGGALTFSTMGPSAGRIILLSAQLEYDVAAPPSGLTSWNLYLYNVTPPSAIADNGAFDIPAGDRASYLGKIALGTLVDEGSTLYIETSNINKQLKLASANLFGYLVTVGGFTPAGNSETLVLTLNAVAV